MTARRLAPLRPARRLPWALHASPRPVVALTLLVGCAAGPGCSDAAWTAPVPPAANDDGLAALGERIFRDASLSEPAGQACATCHDPASGFADGRTGSPTSRGSRSERVGRRNAPTAAYLADCPPLSFSEGAGTFLGGLFLDGRVSSLEAQAQKPLLSPLEMNNGDAATVVRKLRAAPYAGEFVRIFGAGALDDTTAAFDRMAQAIAAFERSAAVSPFTSKFDLYMAGQARLTPAEARGLALFNDERRGNCAACHPSTPPPGGSRALFTDFSYDNIGIPRNPKSGFYGLPAELNPDGERAIDHGLAETLRDPTQDGKFRVPTLRNVAVTGPWGHNGFFTDLADVVRFYNRRDLDARWGPPEVAGTVNRAELGDLGLSDGDVDDLVAFLRTLTDGHDPAAEGASGR